MLFRSREVFRALRTRSEWENGNGENGAQVIEENLPRRREDGHNQLPYQAQNEEVMQRPNLEQLHERSEERRVGKECRSRWSPYQ